MPKKNKIKADVIIDDKGTLKKTAKGAHSVDRRLKGAARTSSNASKNFSKMSQGITGGLVPAYATLAASMFAIDAVFRALSKAADMRVLIQGQQAFAASTGLAMNTVAKSVQAATEAQISFKEASQATAIGFAAGLNADQMERLAAAANSAAKVLGRDVADAFDRMTRGVIKAEPEVLDELGIILRLDIATEKYARSLGVTAESLTTFEKSQAVLNEVLDQAETKYAAIAEGIDPNAFARLGTAFATVAENLSLIVAGPMEAFAAFLGGNLWIVAATGLLIFSSILKSLLPTYAEIALKGKASQDKLQEEIEESKLKIRALKAEMGGMDERAGMATGKAGQIAKESGSTKRSTTAGKLAAGEVISAKQAKAEILRIESSKNQKIHNMNKGQTKAYKAELKIIAANTQTTTKKIGGFFHQMTTKAKLKFTEMKNSYQGIMMSMTRITSAASKAMTAAMAAAGWIGMIIMAATMIWKLIKGIYNFFNPKTDEESKLEKMTESATDALKELNEEQAFIITKLEEVRESWTTAGESISFFSNYMSSLPVDKLKEVANAAKDMGVNLSNYQGFKEYRNELGNMSENLEKLGFAWLALPKEGVRWTRDAEKAEDFLKKVEELTNALGQLNSANKTLANSDEKLSKIQKKRIDAQLKHEYRDEVNVLHDIINAQIQLMAITGKYTTKQQTKDFADKKAVLNDIVQLEKAMLQVKIDQKNQRIIEMKQIGVIAKFYKEANKRADRANKIAVIKNKIEGASQKIQGGKLSPSEKGQQEAYKKSLEADAKMLEIENKWSEMLDKFQTRWQIGIYDATYKGLSKGFEDMLLLKGDLGDMIVGLGTGIAQSMASTLSDQMARSVMEMPMFSKLLDIGTDQEKTDLEKLEAQLAEINTKQVNALESLNTVMSTASQNFLAKVKEAGAEWLAHVQKSLGLEEIQTESDIIYDQQAALDAAKNGTTYDASIAGTSTALKATERLNAGEVAAGTVDPTSVVPVEIVGGSTAATTAAIEKDRAFLEKNKGLGGGFTQGEQDAWEDAEKRVKAYDEAAEAAEKFAENTDGAASASGSFGEKMKSFLGGFGNMLGINAFGLNTKAKGGTIKGYQGGGKVPGTYRGKDSVPAMLAPGEFVFTPNQLKGLSGGSTVVNVNMGEGGATISGQQSDSASAAAFGKAIAGAVNKEISKQKRIGGTLYTQGPGGW